MLGQRSVIKCRKKEYTPSVAASPQAPTFVIFPQPQFPHDPFFSSSAQQPSYSGKKKGKKWLAGSASPQCCKIFIVTSGVILTVSGVPLKPWICLLKEEEREKEAEMGELWLSEKGQCVWLYSEIEGHQWVSEHLLRTEIHLQTLRHKL